MLGPSWGFEWAGALGKTALSTTTLRTSSTYAWSLSLSTALPKLLGAPLEGELVDAPSEEKLVDASSEKDLVNAPSLVELVLVGTTSALGL